MMFAIDQKAVPETKKILYLGLDLPSELRNKKDVTHCPLIRIIPRPKEDPDIIHAFSQIGKYTHFIFTSKSAVKIFFDYAIAHGICLDTLNQKIFLSVGQKTAQQLKNFGVNKVTIATDETAEGMVSLLNSLNLDDSFIFWPHSALSRLLVSDWLQANQHTHYASIFYDTLINIPEHMPDIIDYDEIIFTSPSTIDAFCALFGKLPKNKILTCIGPVTQKHLLNLIH